MSVPITLEYSTEALAKFLDYMSEKGLANKHTIASRKAAASKVLEILDSGEAADLRALDLDEVTRRFANLKGTNYSPESLQVYKSRVSKAVSDFLRYKEDPAAFKPTAPQAAKSKGSGSKAPAAVRANIDDKGSAAPKVVDGPRAALVIDVIDIPVPLSDGALVLIKGLPIKLRERDAAKISAVVRAMISEYDDNAPLHKER